MEGASLVKSMWAFLGSSSFPTHILEAGLPVLAHKCEDECLCSTLCLSVCCACVYALVGVYVLESRCLLLLSCFPVRLPWNIKLRGGGAAMAIVIVMK